MRDERRSACLPVLLVALLAACGSGGSSTYVRGTAHLLNGTTASANASASTLRAALRGSAVVASTNGQYRLTPKQMTVTIKGISFSNPGDDIRKNGVALADCSATYDQTKNSLASLADCSISAPAGTWSMLTIDYGNTYQALFDDPMGFYSTASGLVTSAPSSGAQFMDVTDQNASGGTGQLTLYLPHSVTIDADHAPEVYILFNPIHWMVTTVNNGTASTPQMAGNPPIIAATSTFAKAQYYTTEGTTGAYHVDGQNYGFIVLYLDEATPYLVTDVDGSELAMVSNYENPAVAFNGNTLEWGRYGRLGLDSAGYLAWAPAYYDTSSGNPVVLGYRAMVEVPKIDTVGATTTLQYWSTSSPPDPASGDNYASGHPTMTASPDGTFTLTLLVN